MANVMNSEHVPNNKHLERHDELTKDDDDDRGALIEIDLTINQNERRWHIIYTVALYYCFISVGLCASIFNPTLVQLSEIYGTNLEGISKIFPIRAIGTTLGTLSIGLLTYYVNRQILLFSSLLLKALTVFLVPQWHSIEYFCVNGFFNGFFTSAIIVMVNVWLNEIWSQSARQRRHELRQNSSTSVSIIRDEGINIGNVLMQALHFFFGLGCIFGPLLAEPFLNKSYINFDGFFTNSLVLPFTICSISAILSCFSFFLLYLISPYEQLNVGQSQNDNAVGCCRSFRTHRHGRRDSHHSHSSSSSHSSSHSSSSSDPIVDIQNSNDSIKLNLLKNCVFFLSGIYLMVFIFSEGSYFQFSSSFATQTKLHLNEATAAFLASSLASSFTITRAISILMATKFTPGTMILFDLFIVLLGNIFVFFFSDTNLPLFTSGLVILGAGFASVFPSFFPFLEYHNFVVTDFVGALLTFCGSISEILAPYVIGLYIDTFPMILVYGTFLSVALSSIVFALLLLFIHLVRTRSQLLQQN